VDEWVDILLDERREAVERARRTSCSAGEMGLGPGRGGRGAVGGSDGGGLTELAVLTNDAGGLLGVVIE
jgi:hypothetical protein